MCRASAGGQVGGSAGQEKGKGVRVRGGARRVQQAQVLPECNRQTAWLVRPACNVLGRECGCEYIQLFTINQTVNPVW